MKQSVQIDDDTLDFGFSAVSEADLKSVEKQLQQEIDSKAEELEKVEKSYKVKLEKLHKMIMPLLNNLAKDPDKEYIHWPNRTAKIEDFKKKINKLVSD